MKTNYLRLTVLTIAVSMLLASCGFSGYWIAPPYTSPEKIQSLRSGMSITEVTNVLGIPPYDIFHRQDDGSTILGYNYRLKLKEMEYRADRPEEKHSRSSQTEGTPWYDEPMMVYIYFKDGDLVSLVTDNGLKDSEAVLLTNNTIQLISEKDIDRFSKEGQIIYLNKN